MVATNHQGPQSRFTRYLSGESRNNIHGFMAKRYIALIAYAVVLATAHADHGTPDRPVLHASADGRRHSAAAPIGGYRRGLPQQTHCAARRAFEELGSHIGTAASRAGVIQLEQGRISRPWQPGCRDKPLAALDCPWAPHVPASPARMGRDRDALTYLWARHPEIAGGDVHHVQAVSSRVIPSPPSRCQAAPSPAAATRFATAPETRRPSPD